MYACFNLACFRIRYSVYLLDRQCRRRRYNIKGKQAEKGYLVIAGEVEDHGSEEGAQPVAQRLAEGNSAEDPGVFPGAEVLAHHHGHGGQPASRAEAQHKGIGDRHRPG